MNRLVMYTLLSLVLGGACTLNPSSIAYAQSEDLGLCPSGYSQGLVTTGFVDCYRESSRRSDRDEAERDRLEREAICLANPNSSVFSSRIIGTSSGRFFSEITCQVTRQIAAGTTLCPSNSAEVFRAFDTLVCEYFGSASTTLAGSEAALQTQSAECVNDFGGRVLKSGVEMEVAQGDIDFFFTSLSCATEIPPLDVFECPVGFDETGRSDTLLECEFENFSYETLAEAQAANAEEQLICTGTTAGLGVVENSVVEASTSGSGFFTRLECNVNIPMYGEFADSEVLRACDATCTETVEQLRICLNGGTAGGPGCLESATKEIERGCHTGIDLEGLCPLSVAPMTVVVPLLILDEEPDEKLTQ